MDFLLELLELVVDFSGGGEVQELECGVGLGVLDEDVVAPDVTVWNAF